MRLANVARRAFIASVAGIFGLGLFAAAGTAAADQYGKRDDDVREIALVADDDDGDNTNSRNTRNSRNSRFTNDRTRSNFSRVSRDRDHSRGDLTRDWTRDGGDRTRDFSRNLTNDRSRNDTR